MESGPHYEIGDSPFRHDEYIFIQPNFDSITSTFTKNLKNYEDPPGPIRRYRLNEKMRIQQSNPIRVSQKKNAFCSYPNAQYPFTNRMYPPITTSPRPLEYTPPSLAATPSSVYCSPLPERLITEPAWRETRGSRSGVSGGNPRGARRRTGPPGSVPLARRQQQQQPTFSWYAALSSCIWRISSLFFTSRVCGSRSHSGCACACVCVCRAWGLRKVEYMGCLGFGVTRFYLLFHYYFWEFDAWLEELGDFFELARLSACSWIGKNWGRLASK